MHRVPVMLAIVTFAAAPAFAQLNENLVQNPSFELFTEDAEGLVLAEIPGEPESTLLRATLDAWAFPSAGAFLNLYAGEFGPETGPVPSGGAYYLNGSRTPYTELTQTIDLGFAQTLIGSGRARATLDASLGSYIGGAFPETQDDIATLRVEFLSADEPALVVGEMTIVGPNMPEDVGIAPFDMGTFLFRLKTEAAVPTEAAAARVVIELVRDSDAIQNAVNNAAVDLVRLVLRSVCVADLNGDGLTNTTDINQFVGAFLSAEPGGDINNDGLHNNVDINLFVSAFLAGCD